jgi:hypothetical protein
LSRLPEGEELKRRAVELGVDTGGEPRTASSSGRAPFALEYELQRRVIEAERSIRESKLWKIAVLSAITAMISAIASIVSAVIAYWAVFKK